MLLMAYWIIHSNGALSGAVNPATLPRGVREFYIDVINTNPFRKARRLRTRSRAEVSGLSIARGLAMQGAGSQARSRARRCFRIERSSKKTQIFSHQTVLFASLFPGVLEIATCICYAPVSRADPC